MGKRVAILFNTNVSHVLLGQCSVGGQWTPLAVYAQCESDKRNSQKSSNVVIFFVVVQLLQNWHLQCDIQFKVWLLPSGGSIKIYSKIWCLVHDVTFVLLICSKHTWRAWDTNIIGAHMVLSSYNHKAQWATVLTWLHAITGTSRQSIQMQMLWTDRSQLLPYVYTLQITMNKRTKHIWYTPHLTWLYML